MGRHILITGPSDWHVSNDAFVIDILDCLLPRDAIILSLCMPGVDGVVLQWARENDRRVVPYPMDAFRGRGSVQVLRSALADANEFWVFWYPGDHESPVNQRLGSYLAKRGIKMRAFPPEVKR